MPFVKEYRIYEVLDTEPGRTAQQTYDQLFPGCAGHMFMFEPTVNLSYKLSCQCGAENVLSIGMVMCELDSELDKNFINTLHGKAPKQEIVFKVG